MAGLFTRIAKGVRPADLLRLHALLTCFLAATGVLPAAGAAGEAEAGAAALAAAALGAGGAAEVRRVAAGVVRACIAAQAGADAVGVGGGGS